MIIAFLRAKVQYLVKSFFPALLVYMFDCATNHTKSQHSHKFFNFFKVRFINCAFTFCFVQMDSWP